MQYSYFWSGRHFLGIIDRVFSPDIITACGVGNVAWRYRVLIVISRFVELFGYVNRSSIGSPTRWINRKICIWLAFVYWLGISALFLSNTYISLLENAMEDLGILTFGYARYILQPFLLDFFSFWSLLSCEPPLIWRNWVPVLRQSICSSVPEDSGHNQVHLTVGDSLHGGNDVVWMMGKGIVCPFPTFVCVCAVGIRI